jgi:Cell morphogenesis C-terminal
VLDKGPASTQPAVLEILHCIVYSIDISTASIQAINADLLRVVAKYVEVSTLFQCSAVGVIVFIEYYCKHCQGPMSCVRHLKSRGSLLIEHYTHIHCCN